jgi:hypothetical protein
LESTREGSRGRETVAKSRGRVLQIDGPDLHQVGISFEQCGELRKYIGRRETIRLAYGNFVGNFDKNTAVVVKEQVVPAGDPTWTSMAKVGPENLSTLCERSVEQIKDAVELIASPIERGSIPTRNDVWKLMNVVETASKQSRYFSIVVGAPVKP